MKFILDKKADIVRGQGIIETPGRGASNSIFQSTNIALATEETPQRQSCEPSTSGMIFFWVRFGAKHPRGRKTVPADNPFKGPEPSVQYPEKIRLTV